MSKVIDRSDLSKLSKEDLEYLRERGQLSPSEEGQYLGDSVVTAPQGIPLEQRPNTGDVGPEFDEDAVARAVEADRAGILLGGTPAAPGAPVNVHGAVPQMSHLGSGDYDNATKKELKAELDSRGVTYPSNANHDTLVRLLEEDDRGEA